MQWCATADGYSKWIFNLSFSGDFSHCIPPADFQRARFPPTTSNRLTCRHDGHSCPLRKLRRICSLCGQVHRRNRRSHQGRPSQPSHFLYSTLYRPIDDAYFGFRTPQEAIPNLSKFGKMVELKSFLPFRDAAHALENANDISEGHSNFFHFDNDRWDLREADD